MDMDMPSTSVGDMSPTATVDMPSHETSAAAMDMDGMGMGNGCKISV